MDKACEDLGPPGPLTVEIVNTHFKVPLRFEFDPQPDITAYELARCVPYFHGQMIYSPEDLKDLRRHFKVPQ